MKKVLAFSIIFLCLFAGAVFATGTVDINTATLAQLDTLTGIGPAYAQRIIDNRPYSSVNDLDRVKGIGPKTLQKIIDQGLACVNCGTSDVPPTPLPPIVPTPTPASAPTPAPAIVITYPSGVYINEILPNPQGADETQEWVELYNSNNLNIDLSGWQIQDTSGTTATYTVPAGTQVLANSFLIFKRPDTKIMLNNDEDGINLLTPDKKIADSTTFSKAPLGQSYSKISGSWQWSTILTPGAKNVIASAKVLPKASNSVNNNVETASLADSLNLAGNENPGNQSPWFLFFTVLASTIILAVIVLLIKFKLNNHVRT